VCCESPYTSRVTATDKCRRFESQSESGCSKAPQNLAMLFKCVLESGLCQRCADAASFAFVRDGMGRLVLELMRLDATDKRLVLWLLGRKEATNPAGDWRVLAAFVERLFATRPPTANAPRAAKAVAAKPAAAVPMCSRKPMIAVVIPENPASIAIKRE